MPDLRETAMSDERPDLEGSSARDHALAVGMAVLSAVPVGGGPLATLISEYVPRQKQLRLVRFVEDLGARVRSEQERIDQEFVRTEEFQTMVEDVLDRVQRRRNEEKFRYWADLVAGVASMGRPPRADRERMVETLDRLRLSHLQLLHAVATTRQGPPNTYMGNVRATLEWKMPGTVFDDVRRDWDDLAREDLVDAFPGAMMSPEGAGNLTVRLRPYGQQFVRLLHLESDSAPSRDAGGASSSSPTATARDVVSELESFRTGFDEYARLVMQVAMRATDVGWDRAANKEERTRLEELRTSLTERYGALRGAIAEARGREPLVEVAGIVGGDAFELALGNDLSNPWVEHGLKLAPQAITQAIGYHRARRSGTP